MSVHYADDSVTVHHGDALDVLRSLPDASADAVVTDPPYELGFMGRAWDASGIAYNVDLWREAWRVLKPGGHLLAFGGTRTVHRLTCAIEDAGFEIRDGIDWLYASGFPKSLDVSKAIDKAAGAVREVVGQRVRLGDSKPYAHNPASGIYNEDNGSATGMRPPETAPATDDARRWSGWGTALKPAREPVVWARKPFSLVPLDWWLVAHVHHALAGLLWLSLSPAKPAELGSPSRNPEPREAWCVSARVSAALATSPDESGATGTYSSPALASTGSNIVRSWNAILAALSAPTSTSTTSTASSTTTALRTLNSLLAPITSPTTMPACGCLHGGPSSAAPSAASGSSDAWARWIDTLSRSVPATATEGIALAASSALASIAADLSTGPAAASSVDPTATTRADERCSPAREPIVMARKPLAGTVAGNVLAYGTGALNIDACRVEYERGGSLASNPSLRTHINGGNGGEIISHEPDRRVVIPNAAGRWPANVVLSHASTPDGGDACAEGCVEGCPVAELDGQSGVLHTQDPATRYRASDPSWSPSGTPRGVHGESRQQAGGLTEAGTGASRFFPVFRYQAKAPARERPKVNGVAHPTVKPVALMRWLVRLVCPPGGTVLDPFAGSGTTAEACVVEGFRCVTLERDEAYLPLIVARLDRQAQRPLAAVNAA